MPLTVPSHRDGEPSPEDLLPAALSEAGLTLRPQTVEDVEFVHALYVSHRWEELQAAPGWSDEMRLAFLRDQARMQWHHYAEFYAEAQFLIVEAAGKPVGRLYLYHCNPVDLRIVEIGFMPEWRGRGFGTALLRQVQEFAAIGGKYCSIHVERNNPARNLYRRLGFTETETNGPYLLLEWRPETPQQNTA